jgi:photosystem II stability/assembly factor-like uncharacterized protein
VCGTRKKDKLNKVDNIYDTIQNSVILHTKDSGKTWIEIYKSPENKTVDSFFIVNPNLILMIDENGIINKLSKIE